MEGIKITDFYIKNYKKFLYIPFILLIIAFILLGVKVQRDGDFINRDITLKGGISLTILDKTFTDTAQLESVLEDKLFPSEISIRTLKTAGKQVGIIIQSDIQDISTEELNELLLTIGNIFGRELNSNDYSLEIMGSSLGSSFFRQTIRAMIIAFIFMGIVVFLYFRTFIPSGAVILSALSDIVVTVAIVNILGIKLGTAGIAALLMLIGYSIDTDIMLTTKLLKRKELSLNEALFRAFKTGMTMTLTTLTAITVALIFAQSEVIRQIMTILLIGLVVDIVNTWIQNSGLLIWYVQRK